MNKFIATKVAVLTAVTAISGNAVAKECDTIGASVKKAVTAKPAKVLVIVDETISKNEACACEVVKSAIEASSADKALVREIVVTAVTAAQGMAATIAECAVAQAPEAASEIKAGLSEVFAGAKSGGGKNVVYNSGYSSKGGKNVVIEEETTDFGPEPVVISGVYLIAPVAPSSGGFGNQELEDEIDEQNALISRLRRQANDNRDGGGDGTTRVTIIASPTDGDK